MKFKVKGKEYNIGLSKIDDTLLEALYVELLDDKAKISAQLLDAKRRAKAIGEYADLDWFRKVEAADKIVGAQLRAIQAEQGRRKRARLSHRTASLPQAFLNAARNRLQEEVFNAIFEEAQDAIHPPTPAPAPSSSPGADDDDDDRDRQE